MDIVELTSKIRVMFEELVAEVEHSNVRGKWLNKRDLMVHKAEGRVMFEILTTAWSGDPHKMETAIQLGQRLETAISKSAARHAAKFKKTDNSVSSES